MALHKLRAFHSPASAKEAVAILNRNLDAETLVLAGGTFLHGLEARGLLGDVEELVDIRRAELDGVDEREDGIVIGATTTFERLQALPATQNSPWLGALADALTYPPAQIRNTATVGGCISASCPFFDVPTALLALEAVVTASGGNSSERQLTLPDFFAGMFVNALEPGELVISVSLPRRNGRCASAFIKLEGNANDLAIVNAAASLTTDKDGICTAARIALGGGVADTAVLSPAAEGILLGSKLDGATLQAASEAVTGDISPMSDHRASAEYRRTVAKVIARRTMERAVARLV